MTDEETMKRVQKNLKVFTLYPCEVFVKPCTARELRDMINDYRLSTPDLAHAEQVLDACDAYLKWSERDALNSETK